MPSAPASQDSLEQFSALFAENGILAGQVAGYRCRPGQHRMAAAVADAIEYSGSLVVEAGTGTGKTLAYLIPALLSGRKVVIATGTKSLQQQLYAKDLPAALKASGSQVKVALLKGRSNYLCLHRYELAQSDPQVWRMARGAIGQLRDWAISTEDGDLDAHADAAELGPLWPRITANADNCLGSECPKFDQCHLVRARREAMQADLVVVNHHLLLADLTLREQGLGEVLPGADAYIIDEAHQWPEVAGQFLGLRVSAAQLLELIEDLRRESLKEKVATPALQDVQNRTEQALAELGRSTGQIAPGERGAWPQGLDEALQTVEAVVTELAEQIQPLAPAGKGLEQCLQRAELYAQRLGTLSEAGGGMVRWVEMQRRGPSMSQTPLDVSADLTQMMGRHGGAWILTSATMTVNGDFASFLQRVGMPQAETLSLPSPYNYERQSLMLLPEGMPDPNSRDYSAAVSRCILPLIHASGGGCFLLCTSHRAVQEHAENLSRAFEWPLFVQGAAPRDRLLADFRESGNGILVATSSFWEGVDVRGDALRLVIIEKLPFASPGDPVVAARSKALQDEGRSPFMEQHLPQAVTSLRQGVGRLIRDVDDRGLLVVCDPRIRSKSYGRLFLRSLPPIPQTSDASRAIAFLNQLRVS